MGIQLEGKIEEAISTVVENLGFSIEYVEFVKEGNETFLRIVIDRLEGSVAIEDCEKVSREIEEIVDKLVSVEYILEISSPGLERELKNLKLYQKYLGQEVYIKLYQKGEFGKELVGILHQVDADNTTITLQLNENMVTISLNDIASAHTTFDFDAVFKQDKKVNLNQLGKF